MWQQRRYYSSKIYSGRSFLLMQKYNKRKHIGLINCLEYAAGYFLATKQYIPNTNAPIAIIIRPNKLSF